MDVYGCMYVCVFMCVCIVPMAWVLWYVTKKLNLYESDGVGLQLRVWMCMDVCMCVCVCVCVYVCVCVCVCVCVYGSYGLGAVVCDEEIESL